MAKLYEHEIERTNITPKQFFTYCKKQLEKKGINLEDWVDFETWVNPFSPCDSASKHEDWEEPQFEICRTKAYDWHLFLQKSYNFIMEFDFWDENKGFGYLYVMEHKI